MLIKYRNKESINRFEKSVFFLYSQIESSSFYNKKINVYTASREGGIGMTINKFYTCKYDRPFKEVILNKKNEDLLKWFLEDILKIKVKNIEINTIEMNTGNIHIKRKYADVILKTEVGKIEIEVNACNEEYVRPRNMAYISNIYTNHTLVGKDYSEEVPIIQINFSYGLKNNEKIRVYKIQDDSRKEYVKNFTIYEINMEYYKKIWDMGMKRKLKKINITSC